MRFSLPLGIMACLALTGLIWLLGPYSAHINFAPDQGALWYYWQRPDPDFWSRLSVWGLYTGHQLAIWWLIYSAKSRYSERSQDSKAGSSVYQSFGLHTVNLYALGVNLLFILLHIGQTKLFYDGLAQDVSNMSAQFSVIILLVMVLLLEHKRRGLFFGKKLPGADQSYGWVKRYHGYYFAWAIIYTFWFHPIETTLGHLLGNFYIFLLLLQGSLFYTRFHRNKYWTVLLETFVLLHGAMVAYASVHGESAAMFAFGFAVMFFVTQIYGLGFSQRLIRVLSALFVVVVLLYYQSDWFRALEIFRIPLVLYLGVGLFVGLHLLGKTSRRFFFKPLPPR
ncbi:hypothetical protein [Rheinheimera sp.]|uniref:hypothetical protein n=1 Tax=Rheinheimera sp. TaxID=1869214 RepID=UPI00307D8AB2